VGIRGGTSSIQVVFPIYLLVDYGTICIQFVLIFIGKPYLGKPSDMWALGVVLFTMLYGQFPFYDSQPQELFRKIKAAEFTVPGYVDSN
jgi:serine/threonine protein kinase